MPNIIAITAALALALGVGAAVAATPAAPAAPATKPAPIAKAEVALFAGGCFWSTEKDLERVPGVLGATSGFAGGTVRNPSYEQVVGGGTGHREAVRVVYDPARISYPKLVQAFLMTTDPTDGGGAFCDRGFSYQTGIFALNAAQREAAEKALAGLEANPRFKGRVAVKLFAAAPFYAAEDYHQDYYKKSPTHYGLYRRGCGRDAALREIWGRAPGEAAGG